MVKPGFGWLEDLYHGDVGEVCEHDIKFEDECEACNAIYEEEASEHEW